MGILNSDKMLNEIIGIGSYGSSGPISTAPNFTTGIKIGASANLYGWQSQVVSALNGGKDIYIAAAPSAGKTSPIVTFWAESVLGLNPRLMAVPNAKDQHGDIIDNLTRIFSNPQHLEKILWLVPIRQLVRDMADEFREKLTDVFIQMLRLLVIDVDRPNHGIDSPTIPGPGEIRTDREINDPNVDKYFEFIRSVILQNLPDAHAQNVELLHELFNKRNNQLENIRQFRNQFQGLPQVEPEQDNQRESIISNVKAIDAQISETLIKIIPEFIKNFVCEISGEGHGNPDNALIVVAIYASAPSIINRIRGNVKLIVADEAHLLQRASSDQQDGPEQRAAGFFNILSSVPVKTQLALLSGTENLEAAKTLQEYLKVCFNRDLFISDNTTEKGNPATIRIIADDKVADENYLAKEILHPTSNNTVILLFSKNIIDRIVDLILSKQTTSYTLNQIDKGSLSNKHIGKLSGYKNKENSFSNTPDIYTVGSNMSGEIKKNNPLTKALNVNDPRLAQCISRGFGYMYRIDEKDTKRYTVDMTDEQRGADARIVSDLFREGKIKVLLTTDVIGIGVNIKVQKMIIPRIEKFDGRQNSPINVADLSQILNRTGRASYNIAAIHTPAKCVEDVSTALNASADKFEQRVNVEFPGQAVCRLQGWFISLWNLAMY